MADPRAPSRRIAVNSDFATFAGCVDVFNARYPFYSAGDDLVRSEAVAEELDAALLAVDQSAMAFQGYWEDVVSSVTIGDYATEQITESLPDGRTCLPEVTMRDETLREEELAELEELADAATPGPWFVRFLDDEDAMNLVAVATVADNSGHLRWPEFDHSEIVAATLVQQPRYVDVADGRWDENARFIAAAREAIPRLIAEVRRLRGGPR